VGRNVPFIIEKNSILVEDAVAWMLLRGMREVL